MSLRDDDHSDQELRDIHRRIDSLKEESERQYTILLDKLHALEVAIARGGRFPVGAYGAAVALLLAIIGQGTLLYSELQLAKQQSSSAYALVEDHVKGVAVRYTQWAMLDERCAGLLKSMSSLETRVHTLEVAKDR